jgi:hypothetical protein
VSCFTIKIAFQTIIYRIFNSLPTDTIKVVHDIFTKIWFVGVKSWFFRRNPPTIFPPPSARRHFFKCAPANLKPCIPSSFVRRVWRYQKEKSKSVYRRRTKRIGHKVTPTYNLITSIVAIKYNLGISSIIIRDLLGF